MQKIVKPKKKINKRKTLKYYFERMKASSFIGNLSFFLLAAVVSAFFGFAFIPLYAKILSPNDIGVIETITSANGLLTAIMLLGGGTLIFKEYHILKKEEFFSLISNLVIIQLALIILIGIVLSISIFLNINLFAGIGIPNKSLVIIFIISIALTFSTLQLSLLQIEGNAKKYFFIIILRLILEHSISCVLLFIFNLGYIGRVFGLIISNLTLMIMALYYLKKRGLRLIVNPKLLKYAIEFGVPLTFTGISGWVFQSIDRFMINSLKTVSDTGIYSVGYKFGMIIMFIDQAFGRAWLSYFMKSMKKNEEENVAVGNIIMERIFIYFSLLFLFIVVFIFMSKYMLKFLFSEVYQNAFWVIGVVSFAYFFDGIWRTANGFLLYKSKMKYYNIITMLCSGVNILLNYFFIRSYGIVGAAWSTLISMFLGALITVLIVINIFKKSPLNIDETK